MDQMVNNIRLVQNLTCMLKIYRIYNPMIKILKYKFSKKLLNSITLKMMQTISDNTFFFFFGNFIY